MPYVPLDPVVGPECTRCGCRDAVILFEPTATEIQTPTGVQVWRSPGRAICKHCDCRFPFQRVQQPERPLYAGPVCPECGCDDTKCTHSYPPKDVPVRKRRHLCNQCGSRFSTESAET